MATAELDIVTVDLLDVHARAYAMFKPHAAEFAASGAFGGPVVVPDESDAQTKLLAMLGRNNRR